MTGEASVGSRSALSPGRGLLIALLLLLGVELALHQDAVLQRLRSAFAAGRAVDKVLFVEANPPDLLILGNSRADNGFDPKTVLRAMGPAAPSEGFNLGLPGADARVLAGILLRLDRGGLLGGTGIQYVVLSLDEALVQQVATLGQEVFFADRALMLTDWQYHDWFRSVFRLYGYSDNFRQLREPGNLQRFLRALRADTDPIGGSAAAHAGYRAGFGGLQDKNAAMRQEVGSRNPPSANNLEHLWRMIDLLQQRGVKLAVVFPPLLNRNVLYLDDHSPDAAPYHAILAELQRREIPVIVLDHLLPRNPAEFVNAGHLNDRGAQRYSTLLGQALARLWPATASPSGAGHAPFSPMAREQAGQRG